jgi:hypothetical protein
MSVLDALSLCMLPVTGPFGATQTDVIKAQRLKNGQSAHNQTVCALVPQAEP